MRASHIAAAGLGSVLVGAATQATSTTARNVAAASETPTTNLYRVPRTKSGSAAGDTVHARAEGRDGPVINVRMTPKDGKRKSQRARSVSGASDKSAVSNASVRANERDERFKPDSKCLETGAYDTHLDRCIKQADVNSGNEIQKLV